MDKAQDDAVREFCADLERIAEVLAARIRVEVLVHLICRPSDVTSLAQRLELGITIVSHHLRVLHEAGLLTREAVKVLRGSAARR
jgi:predicted transcriptional regulator